MSANFLFALIIIILIAEYLLSRYLDQLNAKSWTSNIPNELQGIYDEEKYEKAQAYEKANKKLAVISSTIGIVGILLFLFFNGFAWLHNFLSGITSHYILLPLLFFGVLFIVSDIIGLPIAWYKTFVIEEKFGFNKMSVATFISDKLKGYVLMALLGGGMLTAIIMLFNKTGNWFWFIAWIMVTAFSLFFAKFYTSLLLPIFNKLTPLESGELKSAIESYAQKVDFPLRNISIMDGSKRSSKANAFFSGMGKQKSIVLYDTLVEENTTDELVAVLAHEVGHYKKKHIIQSMILSTLQTGVLFFILGYALRSPELSQALGVTAPTFHIGLIAFGILFSPISTFLGILMNRFSRKNEFEADAYAKETSNANALMSALKKLSVNHLSNLKPHPAYVFFYYSHPPLLERLRMLKA